jgi:hypothetical protein
MTATQSVKLYQTALKYFKNENDASSFVSEIEAVVDNKLDQKKDVLATKEDIGNVRSEINKVRTEIAEAKADTIKWMFIFWIGQIGATLGIILLFLKK